MSAALSLGPIARRLIGLCYTRERVAGRGYHAVYKLGEVNICPGCDRTQWLVGRALAECAVCETALPIEKAGTSGAGLFRGRTPEPFDLAPSIPPNTPVSKPRKDD